MSRGYRVWDKQEKTYSDKAFSIDQLGICYVQDEDGYWKEIDDSRFIVEFETGLTDKNADMICEGDRVSVRNKNHKNEYDIGVVEFRKGAFRCPFLLGKYQSGQIEVIGNIHEPPKDFRPEHLKRMGVTMVKGGEE